jgi:serine/threonine protein kinase
MGAAEHTWTDTGLPTQSGALGCSPEDTQLRSAVHKRIFGTEADPMQIGRYVLQERIGSGGMGIVYAARDTELDRNVAVKLLRLGGGSQSEAERRHRLLREGKALARLSHPNVVQVHDVGEHDDRVFVAVELVEGRNAREWIEESGPAWREVLQAFIQAGRGLAAAHDAGIVHRDFKPENVLVGDDGRVRVLDFGLARGSTHALTTPEEDEPAPASASTGSTLATPLTEPGVVMGTPAYMAPEQHLGRPADARTDQFGYCVALHEALYRSRPFSGKTRAALQRAVVGGHIEPFPTDRDVPKRVGRILLRGLNAQPKDRYPDMHELLHELEGVQPPRSRRLAYLAAAAAGGLLALGLAQISSC